MNNKRHVCPLCLSSKKVFNGRKYSDCTLCDEDGTVDSETNDLYCGVDEEDYN